MDTVSHYTTNRQQRHGMIPSVIVSPSNHGATIKIREIKQIHNDRITDTLFIRLIVPPLVEFLGLSFADHLLDQPFQWKEDL